MQRNGKTSSGFGLMDNLNYAYDGNKLNQVTDGVSATDNEVDLVPRGGGNYTYYTDGSVKSDANEGISLIIYDTFLKQPKEIQLTDGRKINHYYDGAGALLKTVYSTGEYWEFGGITYKNGQPYQMAVPEGRAVYVNGSWQYEFFYTDHLGNTRVAFRANGNQLVKTSETAFDPFGVVLRGAGQVNGYQNRFEYQDKEKESTFGLNRINLGARTYNPTTGRMDRVDALADIMRRHSPYQANFNNPLRFLDPDGNEAKDVQDFTYTDGYGTYSARNSSGSVGFSGSYQDSFGEDKPKPKSTTNTTPIPTSTKNGVQSTSKGVGIANATLGFIALDIAVPEPTDAVLPKWAAYTVAGVVAGAYLYSAKYVDKLKDVLDPSGFYYVTYVKVSPDGKVYVGRSSGYGDPISIVAKRDADHHMKGYSPATLSTFAPATIPGGYWTRAGDSAYWAIRGSEQIQIESYRKLGISGNSINGIGPNNGNISKYIEWGRKLID